MGFAVGKAHHLIFDGRAVPRADPFDDAAVLRRQMKVFPDDLMGAGVGVSGVTGHHGAVEGFGHIREGQRLGGTGLFLRFGKVDAALVHSRRGAGLEAEKFQTQIIERARELRRHGLIVGARRR